MKRPESTVLLPHDEKIEKSVISCLLTEDTLLSELVYVLKPEHFFTQDLSDLFTVIRKMHMAGKAVDMLTVSEEIMAYRPKPQSSLGGWIPYIAEVCGEFITSVHLRYHASLLVDLYNRRHLIESLSKATTDLSAPASDYEMVIADISKAMDGVHGIGTKVRKDDNVLDEYEESFNKQESGEESGVRTGFEVFDKEGGLKPGTTVVIGAYPGIGKSAFATAIASNIVNYGVPVGIISLEMPSREIVGRRIAMELFELNKFDPSLYPKLDVVQILWNKPKRSPFESEAIRRVISMMRGKPLYYEEKSASLSDIASSIRDMVYTKHVKVVFVDFLQKILADKGNHTTREELLSTATSLFKTLAKQYDICIVELSQLTPDSNNKGDRTPHYWDLKGAQAIYEHADQLVLINRPEKEGDSSLRYKGQYANKTIKGTAEIIVGKNKNGADGVSYLVGFDSPTTTFYPISLNNIDNCY